MNRVGLSGRCLSGRNTDLGAWPSQPVRDKHLAPGNLPPEETNLIPMYRDYYQLKEKPFSLTPDLKFFFLSSGQEEALAALTYGVAQRKGFMTVLGEFGLGKTTLIQAFLKESAQENLRIITLLNSNISFEELLKFLCRELELPGEADGQPGLLNQLHQGLSRAYESGTNIVLLIDEAHNMPEETLESLRLVSNLEISSEKSIQVVFFGQPEFWEILGHHELRQLQQRIGVRINLSPFTPKESRGYIAFRIKKAGGEVNSIFTKGALESIIHQAGGVPGKLSILSANVMISGCDHNKKPISAGLVKTVIKSPGRNESRNYIPWSIASLGFLLIFLGFTTLDRFPKLLHSRGNPFWVSVTHQELRGEKVTGRVIVETPAPPVRAIVPIDKTGPLDRQQNPDSLGPVPDKPGNSRPVLKRSPAQAIRTVKEGDNFFRMVLEAYGISNPRLWDHVWKHNPGIKDITRIKVGDKIFFPQWKGEEPKNG